MMQRRSINIALLRSWEAPTRVDSKWYKPVAPVTNGTARVSKRLTLRATACLHAILYLCPTATLQKIYRNENCTLRGAYATDAPVMLPKVEFTILLEGNPYCT